MKAVRSLLVLAVAFSAIAALPTPQHAAIARHVYLIGIDGLTLNPSCVLPGSMPNLDRLRSSGASTAVARTVIEAVSGPGWSTFLCAMPPTSTGVTGNLWKPSWEGNQVDISPVTGLDQRFPCALDWVKSVNPSARVSAFYDWDFLSYLVDKTVVDKDFFCDSGVLGYAVCDTQIVEQVVTQIQTEQVPDLTYVYFGDLDEGGGHSSGWCSDTYRSIATRIDGYVGRIVSALEQVGAANNTLIIVSSDHGGSFGARVHGLKRDDNLLIPFIAAGPGIKAGYAIKYEVRNMDVAPTAMAALGYPLNPWWVGRIPEEIFS